MLNLIGLAILVSGILYLNQFRAGLIDAKVQSLLTQGEIIARAIAASAGVDTDEVQLDPEKLLEAEARHGRRRRRRAAQLARIHHRSGARGADPAPLVKPTGSRARVYNRDGALILDSDTFYSRGEVLRYDLPAPAAEEPDTLTRFWQSVKTRMRQYDLPLYTEIGGANGKAYPEVATALDRDVGADRQRSTKRASWWFRWRCRSSACARCSACCCSPRGAATSTISSQPSAGASSGCRCSPPPSPSCCR